MSDTVAEAVAHLPDHLSVGLVSVKRGVWSAVLVSSTTVIARGLRLSEELVAATTGHAPLKLEAEGATPSEALKKVIEQYAEYEKAASAA